VGDFLLSRAFQMMVSDGNLKVLKILSDTSAVIAGGEVLQLSTANDLSTSKDTYLEVITAKTATLFAAACELGAVVSEQEENEEKLRNIGLYLGIAFQLIDDALDYSAVQAELGKTIGDDFREGKVTLPIIIAHEAADDEERLFWQRCIEESNQSREDLKQAMQLLEKHHAIQQTVEEAIRYCDKAAELLNAFENKEAKAAFDETLAFCINRPY
jgi:octaprenyl-diphosphate synthase